MTKTDLGFFRHLASLFRHFATLLLVPLVLSSCSGMKLRLMQRGARSATNDYFSGGVWRLDALGGGVHSYRMGFDRDLIIETAEGLVIVDPFNVGAAGKLAALIHERWPGTPVKTLIYSHYHLDHVRGGAALKPAEIIAHRRCESYWADLDRHDILPPTRTIEGDVELTVGGVKIHLLDLGKSHTDTLYAVYLPAQRLLFAADIVFPRALPPLGHPDIYRPGLLRAIHRLGALDFQTFVPSHFDPGTKQDYLAAAGLYFDADRLVKQYAGEGRTLTDDPQRFNAATDRIFAALYEKYGMWHGGGPMLLFFVQRTFVGEALGF